MIESDKLGITVLASGSAGNATIISCGNESIMIDAGLSCRELKKRIKNTGSEIALPQAILVTHEHHDHICGLGSISRACQTDIYATRPCAQKIEVLQPKTKINKIFMPGCDFQIGPFSILAISISHDAVDAVAYVIEGAGKKIAIATDLGRSNQALEFNLKGCDALLLESNHDLTMLANSNRPWNLKQRILGPIGHLSNLQFADLFKKVVAPKTKTLILGHISRECNTYELAGNCAKRLLDEIGRDDINLHIGLQEEPLATIWI